MRNLVLFAHPEPATLEPLTARLEALGYHTLTAPNGAEALAAVQRYSPQMVVTYTELPELQGTEVCLRLKQDPTTENVAVVLIAPEASAGNRFVMDQVGADAVLFEPLTQLEVCTRIGELFRTLKLNARGLVRKV